MTATRIISEGPGWAVERTGPEEFVNFPGSFAEWIGKTLEQPQEETSGYHCEDCGWLWPLAGEPPAGSECDNCGGELVPDA